MTRGRGAPTERYREGVPRPGAWGRPPRGRACGRAAVDAGRSWLRLAVARPGRPLRRLRRARRPGPLAPQVRRALSALGAGPLESLAVGSTGVWTSGERRALAAGLAGLARRVWAGSDLELAAEACLRGGPGVVVLCGTGSVALGRDASGRLARAGGLGPLLGDEGSAFWIGRRMLARLPEPRARRLGQRPDAVRAVAALARRALDGAPRDPECRRILSSAAAELAGLAERAATRLRFAGKVPVSWWGGLFRDAAFTRLFLAALRGRGRGRFKPVPPGAAPEVYAATAEKTAG